MTNKLIIIKRVDQLANSRQVGRGAGGNAQ